MLLRVGDHGGSQPTFHTHLFGAPPAPVVGASGGVFGLILAYAFLFPNRKVIPLIPPIPMPAWLFATLYAGIGTLPGSHGVSVGGRALAHLGGMVGSALVIVNWRRARNRALSSITAPFPAPP